MKDQIKKLFGSDTVVKNTEQASTPEATVEMLAAKLAAAEAREAELSAYLSKFADMHAKSEAAALQAKLENRKRVLESAIGSVVTASIFERTQDMSDAHFSALLEAVNARDSAEKGSVLFKEVGVEAEVSNPKAANQNSVMDYLLSQYSSAN